MSVDYDLLVHRLHQGACAFQSLRAHRRQRGAMPDPATVAEVRVPAPPTVSPPPVVPESGDSRVTGSREPQAFIALGDRMVPIFGDVNAARTSSAAPVSPGTSRMGEPPPPPRAAPTPEESRPAPPPAPTVSASTLKLPVPTPPPRLGLVHGGHARLPAPEPAATARTEPVAAPTGRNAPAESVAPPTTEEAAATLAAMFDTYAQQEVARLEKFHADHRAALATLLQEHREELRARSEADAARAAQLLREVLAEHRTELARSAQTHAEHLAQAPQSEAADSDLRAALLEQAKLQREANEDVAEHIGALTSIVADLGQTVGMLAVAAAQGARQGHLPTRPTFAAPPRVEPRADVPAPAPCIEAALGASPGSLPTAAAPARAVSTPPSTTAHNADPPAAHRAAHTPASSPLPAAVPATPLAEARAMAAPRQPIRLAQAAEAAAQARVRQFADEDRDDDDLETAIEDDDDPPRRPSLPPITDIDPPKFRERDHG